MTWPHIFAGLGGSQPASYLDDNFNAAMQLGGHTAFTLIGNNTGGVTNAADLSMSQVWAMLKTAVPWEVAAFLGGAQGGASWQVLRYTSTIPNIIVQASCVANAGIAATGSTTFTIADNGGAIGTIVFAASGSTGTVTISGTPYTLAAGHVLTITGPATQDATLANIGFTLGGNRG